jgi:hypothetical protein
MLYFDFRGETMTFDDLITHFGSCTKVAAALAETTWPATKQAIGQWGSKGRIPEGRQHQFELMTAGALKADRKAA